MFTEILFACILTIIIYLSIVSNYRSGMPPGMWGWPVIGKLPSNSFPFYKNVEYYKDKFGKIFTWKIGGIVYVFISDYKLIKEAFDNPFIQDRANQAPNRFLAKFQRAGILNNEGISWSNNRRFVLRYLKDNGLGKSSIENRILYEADCLVQSFKSSTNKPTEAPFSINAAVINVLWGIVAGERFEVDGEIIAKFEQLITEVYTGLQSSRFFIYTYFPWLFNLVPNFINWKFICREYVERINIFRSFFVKCVDDHKESYDVDHQKDFIDAYLTELNLKEQGKGSERTATFTEKELAYCVSNLFQAGSETTSSTIRLFLFYMIKHQDIQKKVQETIDAVVPRSRLPNLCDRAKLEYFDAVIYEVMRIKPIEPLGLYHRASQDTTIGKYLIPKGTTVVSNIGGCHIDPDYWKDPGKFLPERFILPDGSLIKNKESFIPFSVGARMCLGKTLAQVQLYILIGALMQNFSFLPADGENYDFKPNPVKYAAIIAEPLKMIIVERA